MKKVLLIEDNFILLQAIETYLKKAGFVVTAWVNTADAKQKIKEIKPDIGVFDVWVDPQQGDQLCKLIKQSDKFEQFPVILISAKDDLANTAKLCSADDYLRKPFSLPELLDRIMQLLDIKEFEN